MKSWWHKNVNEPFITFVFFGLRAESLAILIMRPLTHVNLSFTNTQWDLSVTYKMNKKVSNCCIWGHSLSYYTGFDNSLVVWHTLYVCVFIEGWSGNRQFSIQRVQAPVWPSHTNCWWTSTAVAARNVLRTPWGLHQTVVSKLSSALIITSAKEVMFNPALPWGKRGC